MFTKKRNEDRTKNNGVKLESLVLQNSRLKFSSEQLQNLNFIFQKKLQYRSDFSDKTITQVNSVAERLIQRLLCGAGVIDSRFASKFLIPNNPKTTNHDIFHRGLCYLVRLDVLSQPCLYQLDTPPRLEVIENDPDCPPAYCRVRVAPSMMKSWSEFLNSSGYLRRDKIQTRLVELIAQSARSDSPNSPILVNESELCGIPGKIVEADILQNLLNVSPLEQVYYGPGGSVPRFPDPRDFRIAIVDEPEGIRLKIEFLSPAFANTCLNVRLLVAIGINAWPKSSNFPDRIPLVHSDCLLYHIAAETGMYLVGFGVQSSGWQIRVPAAENVILGHYSESSTVKTILDILYDAREEIEISRNLKKHLLSYRIINKYILLTVLLEALEKFSSTPLNDLIEWSPMFLSSLVLRILDQLISSLIQQMLPNYFFRNSNLMVTPGHLSEDDFFIEANNIKVYLLRLYDESLKPLTDDKYFINMMQTQESEIILLCKWRDFIQAMLPKVTQRNRKYWFLKPQNQEIVIYSQYTDMQLDYISLLLKHVLLVKQNKLEPQSDLINQTFAKDENESQQEIEDVIYLTILVMDQAKEFFLNKIDPIKRVSKIKNKYNNRTTKFIDLMRADQNFSTQKLSDDLLTVKTILKWLYRAIDYDKKILAPILRSYLNKLFQSSFAISWHLESIKERLNTSELESLGCFCKLVNSGEITPAQGLLDGSNKNWIWAKEILNMVEKHTLRIVFVSDRGKIYRHILSLPSYNKRKKLDSKENSFRSISRRGSTLPDRNYFTTIMRRGEFSESNLFVRGNLFQMRNKFIVNGYL
ncbi:hypothetical protein WA026_010784 [Henosepilachna vigintioctopunctata]|uniref:Mab-21-like HhH/H2TH-like domain-containing protein n=1 Tax=Henosepilachna vigintioctopunctata TaxID=420089 RepID=A0AAW1UZ90_9CUCU